jgi:hypothetical protein
VEVTRAVINFCFKRRLYNVLFKVTYWYSHRQPGAPMINTQSTIHTTICLKNLHSQCYLVATVNHIQSVRSQVCVYKQRHRSGKGNKRKLGQN